MFYSQFGPSKQGPVGTIWIAAQSANAAKLRKCQIVETDLGATCGAPPDPRPGPGTLAVGQPRQ